ASDPGGDEDRVGSRVEQEFHRCGDLRARGEHVPVGGCDPDSVQLLRDVALSRNREEHGSPEMLPDARPCAPDPCAWGGFPGEGFPAPRVSVRYHNRITHIRRTPMQIRQPHSETTFAPLSGWGMVALDVALFASALSLVKVVSPWTLVLLVP